MGVVGEQYLPAPPSRDWVVWVVVSALVRMHPPPEGALVAVTAPTSHVRIWSLASAPVALGTQAVTGWCAQQGAVHGQHAICMCAGQQLLID